MQFSDNLPKTNWPDAPTIQIPWESSMTTDVPPEVEYHCRMTICTANGEEVPELEEDDNQQEYNNTNHHLITHHNTHQESEESEGNILQNFRTLMTNSTMMRWIEPPTAIFFTSCPIRSTTAHKHPNNSSSNYTEVH